MAELSFQIDKGVPIPKKRDRRLFPFDTMEIGDSFFSTLTANRLSSAAAQWVKRTGNGYQFTVRKVEGGIRVWRVK